MSVIRCLLPRELLLAGLLLLVTPFGAGAAPWSAQLEEGGEVSVDPATNRAVINRDGVSSQLWDGVHRLSDGSTITIHSGQVVPNEPILRSRRLPEQPQQADREEWVGQPITGLSPCQELVQRVCGGGGECRSTEACSAVRQLLATEWQERRRSGNPGYTTPASGQCREAESDSGGFFSSCKSRR